MNKILFILFILNLFGNSHAKCVPNELYEDQVFRKIYFSNNSIQAVENHDYEKICFEGDNLNSTPIGFNFYKFDLMDKMTCDWSSVIEVIGKRRCEWVGSLKLGDYCRKFSTIKTIKNHKYNRKVSKGIMEGYQFNKILSILSRINYFIRPSSIVRGHSKIFRFKSGSSLDEFNPDQFEELIKESLADIKLLMSNELQFEVSKEDFENIKKDFTVLKEELNSIHEKIESKVRSHDFPSMKIHPMFFFFREYEKEYEVCLSNNRAYFGAITTKNSLNDFRGNRFGGVSEISSKIKINGYTGESEKEIYKNIFNKNIDIQNISKYIFDKYRYLVASADRWSRTSSMIADKCNPVISLFGFGANNKEYRDYFYENSCDSYRDFNKPPEVENIDYKKYDLSYILDDRKADSNKLNAFELQELYKRFDVLFKPYIYLEPDSLQFSFICRSSNLPIKDRVFSKVSNALGFEVDNTLTAFKKCSLGLNSLRSYFKDKYEKGVFSNVHYQKWQKYLSCIKYKYNTELDEVDGLTKNVDCEGASITLDYATQGPVWTPSEKLDDFKKYSSVKIKNFIRLQNTNTLDVKWTTWLSAMKNKVEASSSCRSKILKGSEVAFGNNYCSSLSKEVTPNLFAED